MKYIKRLIISIILSILLLTCTDFLSSAFKFTTTLLATLAIIDNTEIINFSDLVDAGTNAFLLIFVTTIIFVTIILMLIQRLSIICIHAYKKEPKEN